MTGLRTERRPTAPGAILKELYLKPRNVPMGDFAKAIDVSQKHLSRLVNGHVSVTPDMAVRLSKSLATTTQLWLNLQSAVVVYDAEQAALAWEPKAVFNAA